AHATRIRPVLRAAANPQLAAAIRAATASPTSSRAMVASSLTHLLMVQAMKTSEAVAATVAAAAKGPQPRMPRPAIAIGRRPTPANTAACCTRGAYARLLKLDPPKRKFPGR